MGFKIDQYDRRRIRTRRFFAAALTLGCVCTMVAHAQAQSGAPTTTQPPIPQIQGNSVFLVGHAVGTQGYICLPTSAVGSTASWTVKNARPEATLFQRFFGLDFQIITHFLSPDTNPNGNAPNPLPFGSATWQSSQDSSKVWAQVVNVIPVGTDPSCPNAGSIPCLVLQSIGSQQGPAGGTILSKTTFVERLNTNGGLAPTEGCFTSTDVGNQALVPYTADYYFFRKDNYTHRCQVAGTSGQTHPATCPADAFINFRELADKFLKS
jgi:hypothetical protein